MIIKESEREMALLSASLWLQLNEKCGISEEELAEEEEEDFCVIVKKKRKKKAAAAGRESVLESRRGREHPLDISSFPFPPLLLSSPTPLNSKHLAG